MKIKVIGVLETLLLMVTIWLTLFKKTGCLDESCGEHATFFLEN
jgi:hypothetical protein